MKVFFKELKLTFALLCNNVSNTVANKQINVWSTSHIENGQMQFLWIQFFYVLKLRNEMGIHGEKSRKIEIMQNEHFLGGIFSNYAQKLFKKINWSKSMFN